MRVVIAGAGIGGLTAALACRHHGLEPVLVERAEALEDVGAGIQIPPNAAKVLRRLRVLERVQRDAFRPRALEARMGRSGRRLFRIDLPEGDARWGAPYLHIHRADYVRALADSLPGGVLRLGAGLESFAATASGVSAVLADGSTVEGDVLVGADGIHSAVRAALHGDTPARFTGNVAWRAAVPLEALDAPPPPTACVWMGEGRHAVTYYLRRGELANFVGVVERDDWQEEGWRVRGSREDALADFGGFDPVVRCLIERAGTLHRWALFDRPPLPFWSKGRVSLLGDAAHPMLPFMAAGAAMAVEDAWVLARELSRGGPEAALQRYQAARLARSTRVQAASAANATTFHKRGWPRQLATYGPMWLAGRMLPGAVRARQDWLYGADVTASRDA